MICPKGSECVESNHEVKTLYTARVWFEGCIEEDLPISIRQVTAIDGRVQITVTNSKNEVIHRRG